MAIRFDDRIETNVADDVLITGEQICISSTDDSITIGSDFDFSLYVGTYVYSYDTHAVSIKVLSELPDVINKANIDLLAVTSNVLKPAVNRLIDVINANKNIIIDANKRFFGDSIITGTEQLNNYLKNISNKGYTLPLITLLSAPIKLSTNDTAGGLYYSTQNDAYYGTDLAVIPKDTLICIMSTNNILEYDFTDVSGPHNMGVLDNNIQILSMPVSADSINNNFETRIANIESLLALK